MAIGSTYLSGPVTVKATTSAAATTIMTFNLPSAGTWDIEYFVTMNCAGGGQAPGFAALYDSVGTLLANSEIAGEQAMNQALTTATGRYFITTTAPATYSIRGWNISAGLSHLVSSTARGRTGVVYTNFASTGISGVQGPAGPQGPKGNTGDIGPQGLQGVPGIRGLQGLQGVPGTPGANGAPGTAATVTVGSVTTGAPGSNAQVTNAGTINSAVLNFTLPRGDAGPTGNAGPAGTAATVALGTVTTGVAGSQAQVTNSGNSTAAVFNFTLPAGVQGPQGLKGDKGDKGDTGNVGPKGDKGDTGNVGPAGSVNVTILGRAPNPNEGNIGDIWYQI